MTKTLTYLGLGALSLVLAGCTGNGVDQEEIDRARTALQTSLDAWKRGDKPPALVDRSIEFSDPDWKAGMRLLDYNLLRTEGRPGENIRCWAQLAVQTRKNKKLDKEVVYEIHGKGKIVIGRDPMN